MHIKETIIKITKVKFWLLQHIRVSCNICPSFPCCQSYLVIHSELEHSTCVIISNIYVKVDIADDALRINILISWKEYSFLKKEGPFHMF